MKLIRMDMLLFKIAIIGILVIAIVALVPMAIQASSSKGQEKKEDADKKEADVSCWTPAQFTAQQNAYTEKTCRKYLKEKILNKSDDDKNGSDGGSKGGLYGYLISETLLVVVFYFLARLIHHRLTCHAETLSAALKTIGKDISNQDDQEGFLYASHVKKLSQSRILAILYLVLHLVVAIVWLTMGGAHANILFIPKVFKGGNLLGGDDADEAAANATTTVKPSGNSGEFQCQFKMQTAGKNEQEYDIGCQYTLASAAAAAEAAAPKMALSGLTHAATVANTTLCVAMFIFGIIVIVNVFIIGPSAAKDTSDIVMKKYGVLSKKTKCFQLTDLSLVAMFKPQKALTTKSSEGTQLNDQELKNLEADA